MRGIFSSQRPLEGPPSREKPRKALRVSWRPIGFRIEGFQRFEAGGGREGHPALSPPRLTAPCSFGGRGTRVRPGLRPSLEGPWWTQLSDPGLLFPAGLSLFNPAQPWLCTPPLM